MGRRLEYNLYQRRYKSANEHIKKYAISLLISYLTIHIKTTIKYYYTAKIAKFKKIYDTNYCLRSLTLFLIDYLCEYQHLHWVVVFNKRVTMWKHFIFSRNISLPAATKHILIKSLPVNYFSYLFRDLIWF